MPGGMGEVAQLITAIAALVTSLGGAGAAIIVALRAGRKQAVQTVRREEKNGPDTLPDDENGLSIEEAQQLLELIGKISPPVNEPEAPK